MTTRKRKSTRLPRLTVLSYSRRELERFSAAAEAVAESARLLSELAATYQRLLSRLEALVETCLIAEQERQHQPPRRRRAQPAAVDGASGDAP